MGKHHNLTGTKKKKKNQNYCQKSYPSFLLDNNSNTVLVDNFGHGLAFENDQCFSEESSPVHVKITIK